MANRLPRFVRFTATILAFALFPVSSFASHYAFRTFTPEHGLAATAVFRIMQDEKGYIWFATSEGVSRFDGVEFRNFDVSTGLPDQRVYSMVRDADGRIWFGQSDGVSLFDGRQVRSFTHEDGVARGVAWAASLDRDGRPWFGTQNGGVSVWTGSGFQTYGIEDGVPEEFVYGLFVDSKNRLWIGTRNQGVAVVEISDGGFRILETFSPSALGDGGVRDFVEDASGNVYAATRGAGVVRFDGESLELNGRLLEGRDIYSLLVTRAGELVAGEAYGGIHVYTIPDLRFRFEVGEHEGLPSEIFSLYEGRDGGLWIGTGVGMVRWAGEAIRNYDRRDGLAGSFVLGIVADGERSVWVSSARGATLLETDHLGSEHPRTRTITRTDGLPSEEVWQVHRDRWGQLWIATAEGLCLYTEGRGCRTLTTSDGLPSNYVTVVLERPDGDLWVGAAGGVVRLEHDSTGGIVQVVPTARHPSLDAANLYALEEDAHGTLWIATDAGLLTWNSIEMRSLGRAEGLPARGANDVLIDRRGDLWVATSGYGVARLDAESLAKGDLSFRSFRSDAGLPSNTALALVEGDDDTIWVGTPAGIAQVDTERARSGAVPVVRRQLTAASGLIGSEPGSGGSFARTDDGVFWFGLARGVSRYDPSLERGVDVPPTVEIGRVIANREAVFVAPFDAMAAGEVDPAHTKTELTLTHRTNDLTFEYRGLSFHDPTRVFYQVQLEGFEPDWSPPTFSRTKEYTHLPPGDFVFRVRAISATGLVSDTTAEYSVTINPPFWAAEWFPMVVIVGLAFLAAMIVQFRAFSVRQRNRELAIEVAERTADLELRTHDLELANARIVDADLAKSRFLASMSHELRTPLNSIIGFTELMMGRQKAEDERGSRFLGNVQHSAHQLLGLITDLLDLSKIEAGKMEVFIDRQSLPTLVESVVATLQPLATPREITIERDVSEDLPVVLLDGTKVRQILYNLLSNAIRFSPTGSSVRVVIRELEPNASPLSSESVVIEVHDCGIGIPPDEIQTIFEEYHQSPTVARLGLGTGLGLTIVRKFAELQGGTVQVAPNDNDGSTFRVWLPQNAVEFETDSGQHRVLAN